eukprot:3242679-Lingulodinium_polyedra.AAC.1
MTFHHAQDLCATLFDRASHCNNGCGLCLLPGPARHIPCRRGCPGTPCARVAARRARTAPSLGP